MRLLELPSGSIDIADDGHGLRIEFNAICTDALPYCRALCCRMRPDQNVPLTEEETRKFTSTVHVDGFPVMGYRPNGSCVLLDENFLCRSHDSGKPAVCQLWHCSPGGKNPDGKLVPLRDRGWRLSQ